MTIKIQYNYSILDGAGGRNDEPFFISKSQKRS
jgi:hypothetical protein